MGFQGVYRALYDYRPQAEAELSITEGDLLYILEKDSDDGWWKAKKKANTDDGDEPIGLIPNNYVEEASPLGTARALYEYTRQTDEELSFPEDASLAVFDTSDEDWILVGLGKDYGFVPANYIEVETAPSTVSAPSQPVPPSLPTRPLPAASPSEDVSESRALDPTSPASLASPSLPSPTNNPAAALAGVMQGRAATRTVSPPPATPQSPHFPTGHEEEEDSLHSPALPARPASQVEPHLPRPRVDRSSRRQTHIAEHVEVESAPPRVPGGFHMYNINEMVSVMGKRKKMPTTLGINLGTGTILVAPERAQDGPTQEWTAEKMTHYSREGKHVFVELVKPSKSVDFHAGAKDTAEEIVSALGELAGAVKASGLRDVILAGTVQRHKRGQVLYDFMAQGDDEVTVAIGDEVIIIDDSKSEEWWQVRRTKNGKEGVVPSSYIEITGTVTPPTSASGLNAGISVVEQNRQEEIRLTKEALKAAQRDGQQQQVGPGMPLPERGSSLLARERGNDSGQRSKRENGRADGGSSHRKSKPEAEKVRTWTDRSKSFSVDAQFLGLKDGKINLHKMNGVKIAVPVAKMSLEDLEYVEKLTGISLDEDKPLSNVRKSNKNASESRNPASSTERSGAGASVDRPQKPEYDWFQFFLSCDVAVGVCERYAQAFSKESMDESVLPDVDASVLRNLGLREGDILKVMRTLDAKFGRAGARGKRVQDGSGSGDEAGTEGGLFSGPGGALRNNTKKSRPAPAVQTNNVVDAKALATGGESNARNERSKSPASDSAAKQGGGFDDNAWDVKPAKRVDETPSDKPADEPPKAAPAPLTGSMQELSLLTSPLEPTRSQPSPSPAAGAPNAPAPAPVLAISPQPTHNLTSAPTGATPAFFAAGAPGNAQPPQQRQRPTPPQTSSNQGGPLIPPPAARPLSAPQSAQAGGFAPPALAPQMTGVNYQTRVAPPGQSLEEMNQARLQQQYLLQLQQQQQFPMSGFPNQQQQGMHTFPPHIPQAGGQFVQPMMTGTGPSHTQSPFTDPTRSNAALHPQNTGFPGPYGQQQPFQAQPTGINSYLPSALEPQRTGMPPFQPQPTGVGSFNPSTPAQPLQPQKTGPAPPVRFGVTGEAKKLAPQPTGRRANLAQATPNNPFGF